MLDNRLVMISVNLRSLEPDFPTNAQLSVNGTGESSPPGSLFQIIYLCVFTVKNASTFILFKQLVKHASGFLYSLQQV